MGVRTFLSRLLVGALVLACAVPAVAAPVETQAQGTAPTAATAGTYRKEKLHPTLRKQVDEAGDTARFTVIIKGRDKARLDAVRFRHDDVVAALKQASARSQGAIVGHLQARGARVLNRLWLVNAVVAEVDKPTLQSLVNLNEVDLVYDNFRVAAPPVTRSSAPTAGGEMTWGLEKIQASRVWSELGITGAGIRVAVLDTGVDINHPDLAGKMHSDNPGDPTYPGGWVEFGGDGAPVAGSEPHDSDAHGTHVSGTVAGGSSSGTAIGVAPGATLMHGLVLPGGGGTFAQVVGGMQWAIEPFDGNGNPAGQPANIASMSFGAGGLRDEVVEAIRNMYFAGTLPIAAIGNCGDGCVGSPGAVYEAFGIGASAVDDSIAEFSSGARISKSGWKNPPDEWPDEYIKPDISAPGAGVMSAVPGGGYDTWDGTSMATPHASGVAALMLAANPGLTPSMVLATLQDTSFFDSRYGDARPNTRYGYGRIDAYEAVSRIAYNSGITGKVTDAASAKGLDQAVVSVNGTNRSAKTGADGSFSLLLPAGTYTLKVERFGYAPQMLPPVTVPENQKVTVSAALSALPRGIIRGQVQFDRTGHGIPGVAVKVMGVPIKITADTDADGRYELSMPVGAYDLQFTGFGFGQAAAAGVAVLEAGVTEHNVAMAALPRIAVVGDMDNTLAKFLQSQGYLAESVGPEIIGTVDAYSAVVVNLAYMFSHDDFRRLVDNAHAAGVGMIFTKSYWFDWGIDKLSQTFGDPVSTDFNWFPASLNAEVVAANADLLGAKAVGETFPLIEGWPDIAWFEGYSGTVVADLKNDYAGRLGNGVAFKQNANNRHVLLGSFGATYWQGPNNWTEDGRKIFMDAVKYVARPETDGPKFVYWNLAATPDAVLWSEPVSVSVGVKNIGAADGSKDVMLRVGEEFEPARSVSLASGSHSTATFTVQREKVGSYKLAIGHLSAAFRVRPPRVSVRAQTIALPPSGKGKNADPGEPAIPLADAMVELVKNGKVISRGKLDAAGMITFDSTASRDDYTLVVRHVGYGYNIKRHYLLTMPVHVEADTSFQFVPAAADMARLDLNLASKGASHHGSVFISGGALGKVAYEFPTGQLVTNPGEYRLANVMAYDVPGAQWAYASEWELKPLAAGSTQAYSFGGDLALRMSDVRGQQAPGAAVTWSMTDAAGHSMAGIYRTVAGAFGPTHLRTVADATTWPATVAATAQDAVKPVLTLTSPAGAIEQTGTIGWNERPKAINLAPEAVVPGEYALLLQSDTGPYMGKLEARASLLLPARSVSRTLLRPGDTFEVTVVFDAGKEGTLSLTEQLPAGFHITKQSSVPNATFSGNTWTWQAQGKGAYRPGQTMRVTYTVQVGADVAGGTYTLSGTVSQSGAARSVAGPPTLTVVR